MNVGLSAEVRYHWFREHLVVVGDWHRLSPLRARPPAATTDAG